MGYRMPFFCRDCRGATPNVERYGVWYWVENKPVTTSTVLHSSFRRQKFGRTNLGGDLGGLGELTAALDALKDGLTVLIKLELGNDDVGGVDADGDGGTGGLVAGDALDVDDVLEAVDGSDLALLVLVGAADNGDLVVLADGDGADLPDVSHLSAMLD